MQKILKRYFLSISLILLGILIHAWLGHLLSWWLFVKIAGVFLPAIGVAVLLREPLLKDSKQKENSAAKLLVTLKKLAFIVALFAVVYYVGKLGDFTNYQVRRYYLQQETRSTDGFVVGVIEKELAKGSSNDFYLVEFTVDGEQRTYGLPVDYAMSDSGNDKQYFIRLFEGGRLTVNGSKLMRVKVDYSVAHPSFFKVQF